LPFVVCARQTMSGIVRRSKLRDDKIHLSFNSEESFIS
jgi:hypothetical protein